LQIRAVYRSLSNERQWKEATSHLSGNVNIIFSKGEDLVADYKPDYLLCICYGDEKADQMLGSGKKNISNAISIASKHSSNVFVVLPYIQYSEEERLLNQFASMLFEKHKEMMGLVYIGETIGPRVNLLSSRPIKKLMYELLADIEYSLPLSTENHTIYPTDVSVLSKRIVRNIFSFGGVGERKTFVSSGVSFNRYVNELVDKFSSKETRQYSIKDIKVEQGTDEENVASNIVRATNQTINWYRKNFLKTTEELKRKKERKSEYEEMGEGEEKMEAKKQKPLLGEFGTKQARTKLSSALGGVSLQKKIKVLGLTFAIILSPYIFYLLGTISLFSTLENIKNVKIASAEKTLKISSAIINVSQKEFEVLSSIPLVGRVFETSQEKVKLVQKSSRLTKKYIDLLFESDVLVKNALSQDDYDFNERWSGMKLLLNEIYEDLSFLESELNNNKSLVSTLYKRNLGKEKLSTLRSDVLHYRQLVGHLDWLLGANESRKYMILLQDDSELRPTGGFLNFVVIVEAKDGTIVSKTVHSTESLDSKLKGVVSPPESLREYLSEDAWFLRDSNWDPDFPTSAKQAEWFVNKEVDESVDGVIAVNLSTIAKKGEIDFLSVNEIEKVIEESIGTFISGSQDQFVVSMTDVIESLDQKDVQVYFHNNSLQDVVSELLWDGSVYSPECEDNCVADMIGFVEANVGINKVNKFIERRSFIETAFEEGVIKNKATIELFNSSSSLENSNSNNYKVFLRLLAPYDSLFSDVGIVDISGTRYISPQVETLRGRKEAGIYLELPAGQRATVTFEFEKERGLTFNRQGEYRMVLRKQSGVPSYPVEIRNVMPENLMVNFSKPFSLTNLGYYRYNTELARDYFSRIFW